MSKPSQHLFLICDVNRKVYFLNPDRFKSPWRGWGHGLKREDFDIDQLGGVEVFKSLLEHNRVAPIVLPFHKLRSFDHCLETAPRKGRVLEIKPRLMRLPGYYRKTPSFLLPLGGSEFDEKIVDLAEYLPGEVAVV